MAEETGTESFNYVITSLEGQLANIAASVESAERLKADAEHQSEKLGKEIEKLHEASRQVEASLRLLRSAFDRKSSDASLDDQEAEAVAAATQPESYTDDGD